MRQAIFGEDLKRIIKKYRYCFVLVLLMLVYSGLLHADFVIGDDDDQILRNRLVQEADLVAIWTGSTYENQAGQNWGLYFRPVMLSIYAGLYQLAGPTPIVFHGFQLGLHLLSVLLLMKWLEGRVKWSAALVGALVFGLHPVQVEAVAHVASLQEVLYGLCGVGLLLSLDRRSGVRWWEVGLWMLWGILSKESMVVLILMAGYWVWQTPKIKRVWWMVMGFVLVAYLGLRIGIAGVGFGSGGIGVMTTLNLQERLLAVPAVLGAYGKMLLWPLNLQVHQYWNPLGEGYVERIVWFGVFLLIWWLGYRRVGGRWYLMGSVGLASALLLHSQLVPLYVTVAERWLYGAMLGVGLMVAVSLDRFGGRAVAIGLVLALVMAVKTLDRVSVWRDSETLLERDYEVGKPGMMMVANMLGSLKMEQGEYVEALPYFEASVGEFRYFGNVANLALVQAYEGEFEPSRALYRESITLGQNYGVMVNYVTTLLHVMGDARGAELVGRYALELYPESEELMGLVQAAVGAQRVGE